jgi:hypothetical protein
MSKNCKTIYLDQFGKESKVYLDNLHQGEDIAKKLYLESMAGLVSVKFQKGDPNSSYTKVPKKDTELLAIMEETYKSLGKVKGAKAGTKVVASINENTENLTLRDFAENQLFKEKQTEIRSKLKPKFNQDILKGFSENRLREIEDNLDDLAESQAEQYYSENIDPNLTGIELQVREKEIAAMKEIKNKRLDTIEAHYEVQRQYGSEVHGLMELYINLRSEYLEKTKNYSNRLDGYITAALVDYAYKKFYANLEWTEQIDEEGNKIMRNGKPVSPKDNISEINKEIKLDERFFDESKRAELDKYIKSIQLPSKLKVSQVALGSQLKNLEAFLQKQGEGASFKTELSIGDGDFKLRGIADLLVFRKDGTVLPVDYKTKTAKGNEVSKLTEFSSTNYGKVKGSSAFKNLFKNKKTDVNIQLTIIKEILEKNGFKDRVMNPVAILITGKFEETLNPRVAGQYTEFKFEEVELPSIRREFRNYVADTQGYVVPEEKTAGYQEAISTVRELVDASTGEYTSPESLRNRIAEAVNRIRVDEEGTFLFRTSMGAQAIPDEHSGSVEARKKYVTDYFKNNKDMDNAEQTAMSVIEYFDEKKNGITENFSSVRDQEQANRYDIFLAGINPHFYNLSLLKNYEGFGDAEYSNVLVAEHKKTKTLQLIEVAATGNTNINFQNGNSRNSIFGNYLKDGSIVGIADFSALPNKAYSGGLLRLSLVAAQLATNINYNGVDKITVGSPTLRGGSENIETAVPQDMVLNLEVLKAVMDANPDDFKSDSIKKLLSNKDVYDITKYKGDPLATWYSYLIDFEIKQAKSYAGIKEIESLKEHYEEKIKDTTLVTQETRDLLFKAILKLKTELQTQEAFAENLHAKELVKAYLHLERIPVDIVESVSAPNFLFGTMQSTQNETIKALNKIINIAKEQTLNDGIGFLSEHAKLIKKLKKDQGIMTNRLAFEQTGMLEGMLVDNYKSREGDWLKFKPDNQLQSSQLEYKKFFQKTIKETLYGIGEDADKAYKNDVDEKIWDEDWIPAIAASKTNRIQEAYDSRRLGKTVQLMFDSFGRRSKGENAEGDSIYNLENDSITAASYKGIWTNNFKRKRFLGQMEWDKGDTPKDVETNIESVLNYMVMKKINTKRQQKVVVAASAIHSAINMEKEFNHKTTDPLLKYINDIIKLNVLKTVDEPTTGEAIVEKVGKSVSTSALFASAGLFSVEMVTSVLGTLNSGVDNVLRSFVGKTFKSTGLKPRYNNIELWKRAAKMITFQEGEKSIALDRLFGISTMDPNYMAQKMSETKNKSLLNRQKVYELMSFASRGMRRQMLMARMEIDRTVDAYEYDRETDSLTYFPEKDVRLFIESHEGRPPRTDEEKKKAAYYKALRSELEREGFIKYDEAGKETITRPYATVEIAKIKEHADVQYGSLDGEEKFVMEKHAMARAFLVLKKFIIPKIKMYWRGETGKYGGRDTSGNFEYDEKTGEYHLNTTPEEGIIQTMLNFGILLNNLYGFSRDATLRNREGVMKQFWNANRAGNMTKLMSDFSMMFLGYLVTAGLTGDDEDDEGFFADTVYGKAVLNGIKNATMDYNFAFSIYNMFSGDSLIGFSILMRAADNIMDGFWNSPTSEFHYDQTAILKALDGMSGLFRTTHGGIEIITQN